MDHEEIIRKVTSLEGSMKTIFNRVEAVEEKVKSVENKQDIMHEMNTNIKLIAQNQENQGKDITDLKCDVKDLKEKPGKRWDALTAVIIAAMATGLVGFLLGLIFK